MTDSAATRWWLGGAVVYLALLGVILWPWIRVADHAIPSSAPVAYPDDARLLVAEIASALRPRWLGDAFRMPIFHPAPGQLLGTEVLPSSLPLAAPFLAATGNATLAASGAALLGYPLGAIAMDGLLLELGCAPVAAWTTGLLFALGPLRLPGNIQILQYSNFWFPLVACTLSRLRRRPTAGRAIGAGLALAFGGLSSLYMVPMVAICGAIWFAFEAARRIPGRRRFLGWGAAAAAVAAIPIGLLGWRYASHVGTVDPQGVLTAAPDFVATLGAGVLSTAGPMFWVLSLAGLAAALLPGGKSRRWAFPGAVILLIASALAFGPRIILGGLSLPGPFALLAASPLRYFRLPWRFVVLSGFGGAILAAAALDAATRVFGARVGSLAALAVAGLALAGARIDELGIDRIDGQTNPVYDEVARASRERGPGPLLELPIDAGRDALDGSPSRVPVGDSMIGASRHGLPLAWGFTGYPPAHEPILRRMIGTLDRPGVLGQVVDMTHARWILLRPSGDWRDPAQRERILTMEGVEPVASQGGWDLLRVTVEPGRPDFFAAIAAGPRAGRTPLGTPLDGPRALSAGVGVEASPRSVRPGEDLHFEIALENLSSEPWPATDAAGRPAGVSLVVELRGDGGAEKPVTLLFALPHDLLPGARLRLPIDLKAPGTPGTWKVTAFPHREGVSRARLRIDTRPGAGEFDVVAPPAA